MSMSNASETNLLELLFNNTAWPNVGDASGLQPRSARRTPPFPRIPIFMARRQPRQRRRSP